MKSLKSTILFLIIFFNQLQANQNEVKIAITTDMIPYSYMNEYNEPSGILVDYWKLWAKKSKIKIKFVPSAWLDTLKNMKEKKVDIHSGLFLNKQRQEYVEYLKPIYNSITNIYINKKNKNKIKTIKDLENKTIGLISGTYFESYLKKNHSKIKIIKYETYKELFEAITSNEVDSFIEDSLTTWFQLLKFVKFNEVEPLSNFKINKWFYVGIAKNDDNLERLVSHGMDKITDIEMKKIEKRWIFGDNLKYFQKKVDVDFLTKKERYWLDDNPLLQLAVVNKWERYSFLDEDGKIKGFHLDLLKQINENLDTNIKYKVFDKWANAYEWAKKGRVDGIFGLSWSKEREKYFNYSPSYKYSPYYMVTRVNENKVRVLEDYNNKNAVTFKNSITNKIIKDKAPNVKILHVNNMADILKNIRDKKADVALLENAKSLKLKKYGLKIVGSVYAKEGELSIGTYEKNLIFADIIKKGITSISEEQMQSLDNKWFKKQKKESIFTLEELSYIKKSPVLKVGIELWKPIIFSQNKEKLNGIAGEIISKIFDNSGLKFKYVFNTWNTLLGEFKKNKIDILPVTFFTKERANYGLYSEKYLSVKEFLYVKSNNNKVKSFKDLNYKKLAIVKGYATISFVKKKFPNVTIVETDSLDESIQKVLNEDVDALFEAQIAVQHQIRELLITNLKAVSQESFKSHSLHLFVPKNDKILQSIINKSLFSLSVSDKNKIINKWLNLEVKKNVNVAFGISREPYVFNNTFLKGIEYDLVKRILNMSGISINNEKHFSLSDIEHALENNNELDIAVTTKENNDGFYYSNNFLSFENVAITRLKDNFVISDIKDLQHKKISAFQGAKKYLGKEYRELFNSNNDSGLYQETSLQEKQVRDFINGKMDVLILDKNIFKWYLKKLSDESIDNYKFDFIFSGKNSYKVAFKDENLRNIFNDNLLKIKSSGEYKNIFDSYTQNDIEAKVKIDSLIASSLSKYIFDKNIKEIKQIIDIFEQLEYIDKIEVFNKDEKLLVESSSLLLEKFTIQESFYMLSNIPSKVGFIKVYFDESQLKNYSENLELIPNIKGFNKLKSFIYVKDIYKQFGYLDKKIVFTKKEKLFIQNNPILTFSEVNWQPLSIIENGMFDGLFNDYLKIIEEKSGLSFKLIVSKSWAEVLEKFKQGELDLIPSIAGSLKEKKLGSVSGEYLNFKFAIVSNKNGSFVEGIHDLHGKTVALPKGYSSYNMVKENYTNINIIETKDIEEALTLVSKKEAYAFIGHSSVAVYKIKKSFPELKIIGLTNEKFRHHMLIQNSKPELLSIVNKILYSITQKQKEDLSHKWIRLKIDTAVDYSIIYKIVVVFVLILSIVLVFTRKLANANKLINSSNEKLEHSLENLKLTQEKLLESKKMASLGGLVAGIAHEINTPVGIGLTGVTHFLHLTENIKKDYESENMSREEFEKYINISSDLANQINLNLIRTAHLVKSFKQIAVDQTSEEKRLFNLKNYVNEVLLSINSITKKTNLQISISCDDDIEINSYPGIFSQIVSNFIINSIRHAYKEKEKGNISIFITKDDDVVKLIYTDDGCGIPKENLEKIFEPFFTTNRDGGGTGLGLNIIYNIVNNILKGTIHCESKEGQGTKFIITILID